MIMDHATNTQGDVVNRQELLDIVYAASSQVPAQVQASTERLKMLLENVGTYDALHEIAAEKSLPLQVRQQSIIQFKNSALSHWRSRKLLSEEYRNRIRARCMVFLREEDDLIAECNEVIVAKIARLDFPHNWPSLLTDLISIVESTLQSLCASSSGSMLSTLALRRALKVLNAVLKEISSMKMLTGIKTMGEITNQLCGLFLTYYSELCRSQLSPILSPLHPAILSREHTLCVIVVAHLIYKCLIKLALWSWPRIVRHGKDDLQDLQAWFLELFQSSTAQLKLLSEQRISFVLGLRSSPRPDPITAATVDILTRHVRIFGKFFRRLQQLDPAKFVELPTCNAMVLYYWEKVVQAANGSSDMIKDSPDAVFPIRFLVQAMVLFKENLAKWTPFRKGGPVSETTLSQQFVEDAVRLLVTRFIPLNPTDLEGWMSDPEEWVNEEDKETDHWEYELRPCGERVLMTLASQYRDYVVPLMATTFKDVVSQPTTNLQSVIQKEAIYCAIGRCASRLRDVIPFTEWMRHYLAVEAKERNPNFPIIKRRIAWLIGRWIGDMSTPATDPILWEVLIHLLSDRGEGTDAVVRFTAANALRECVDTVSFDITVFAPFLPAAVTELVRLMHEVDTIEMKRRLAKSLNVIIERADLHIVPHVEMIAEGIPGLWTAAGDEWLFKAQLLVVITSLITSAKEHSSTLVPLVIPLVQEGLSPGVAVHLDEDALGLWHAALRNAPTLQGASGPSLLQLFPLAISLLVGNLDLLGKVILIVESYLFVDAPLVLQNFALELLNAVANALSGQAIETNQRGIITTMCFMTQLAPSSFWAEALHNSGFFNHVVKILREDECSSAVLTDCVFILARIAVADHEMFLRLVSAAAHVSGVPEDKIWEPILDQYWRQFDHMSEPRHRKLAAMGIATLVSTGRNEVLDRLPNEIFNLWTDVLYEIRESLRAEDGDDDGGLRLYWDVDVVPDSYYSGSQDTLEYDRRKLVYERDPVRVVQLTSYLASALQEAERACGGAQVFKEKYLDKTDPTVLMQLKTSLAG
ncbi:ARM repeat-containing protein [Pisolithus croceorrhizus]|nr:ARM repeat-containing protein [Pisolithus croceorrhizus]